MEQEEGPVVKIIGEKLFFTHACNNPVLEKLRYFKDKGLYCDVVLMTKDNESESESNDERKQLDAHSCMLASGSALFEKLFLEQKIARKTTNYVNDITFDNLQICLDFIYRKPVEFLYEDIDSVIDAAQKLEIYELEKWCKSVASVISPVKDLSNDSSDLATTEDSNPEQSIHLEILENPIKYEENDSVCDELLQEKGATDAESDKGESNLASDQSEIVFHVDMDKPESMSVQGTKLVEFDSISDKENDSASITFKVEDTKCLSNKEIEEHVSEKRSKENGKQSLSVRKGHYLDSLESLTNDHSLLEDQRINNETQSDIDSDDSDKDELPPWKNQDVKEKNCESNNKLENATEIEGEKEEPPQMSTAPRLFYCCHCKTNYDNATHYCYIVDKTMRLRLSYPCQVCGEMVSSSQMSRHRKKHPEGNDGKPIFIIEKKISGKTFYCRFCEQSFNIGYHFCTARNKKVRIRTTYMCPYCGKNIPGGGFYNHIKRHNPDNKQKCEICGYIADNKRDFSSHMVSHDSGKIFPCNICGKCYKGPHSLSEHRYRVHDILKPRKRFKNDSIYQCPECDFENYSSTLVSLHIVKEHKSSKSEKVRQYINLYNKKKNGKNVMESIPEYESLKDIIKKKEISSNKTETVSYNNTEIFDIGDNQNNLPQQMDYAELGTKFDSIQTTKESNDLDCKVSVLENQPVYSGENLVILSTKAGTADYTVVNFEDGTAAVPNSCSESASLGEQNCILYNTAGDSDNIIQYTDTSDYDGHNLAELTGANNTVTDISNDSYRSPQHHRRMVKIVHQNRIIPVNRFISSQQQDVQLVESGNVIIRLAQSDDNNIAYSVSEEEAIGETIEVVSEIQGGVGYCDNTDDNEVMQQGNTNMDTLFIQTDT